MFKKRERPGGARKRDTDDCDGEAGVVPTASKKRGGDKVIVASTKKNDASIAAFLEGKADDATFSGLKATNIAAPRPSDDAVRLLEIETEVAKDQRAIHERNDAIHKGLKEGILEKGVYRGQAGYMRYANRGEGAISASKYTGLLGPTRNTLSNVRSTMRVEYWNASSGTDGGVCKDYKETGYCGFGDSCIYLHDRSDYKQGYQLEAEWEAKMKAIEDRKRKRWERSMQKRATTKEHGEDLAPNVSESDSDDTGTSDEELPTSCPGCHKSWESCTSIPIQTVCGHYFCEDCAMANFARTPKCLTCDAPTNGIFNSCEALGERLKAKQTAKRARLRQGGAISNEPG